MAPVLDHEPTQIIQQKPDSSFLEGIVARDVETLGNITVVVSIVLPRLALAAVPASFFSGLEDCEHGRTVDMEQALRQSPCGCATT